MGEIAAACPRCRLAPELRAQWGCDEPSTIGAYWFMRCPRCDGFDQACELCRGGGRAGMDRCPPSMVTRDAGRVMDVYAAYKNGVLPDPGGWYQQTALFGRVIRVVESEVSFIREARERARKMKKDRVRRG